MQINRRITRRQPRRRSLPTGFTFIELLVCTAILGVATALLLPAVHSSRASARRHECKRKLYQVGLGLRSYHDSHGCFPVGSYVMGPAEAIQSGWGWAAMILPAVDQAELYNLIDFGHGTATGTNLAVIGTPNSFWRCPSDLDLPCITATPSEHPPYVLASGNYCGSEGILRGMSHMRIAEITDGASRTLLAGERLVQSHTAGSLPFTSAWCGQIAFEDDYDSASIPHLLPSRVHFLNSAATDPDCFGSRHPGGANFVLADGSLCFINNNIDLDVYEALGTADGGETAEVP